MERQNSLKRATSFASREDDDDDDTSSDSSSSIRLIFQNSLNSPEDNLFSAIMVPLIKGRKLRELLQPVCASQNIDLEKVKLFDQSLASSTSLVDLDSLCDTYSGARLLVQGFLPDNEKLKKSSPVLAKSVSIGNETLEGTQLRKKSFQGLKSENYQNNRSMNIDENSVSVSSSNNWHSYFNNKMITKEKPCVSLLLFSLKRMIRKFEKKNLKLIY